jgi:DNA replication and repair protein RecF
VAITALWLTDFRCFSALEIAPDPDGLTVLRGDNGAGKTSILEAVAWLATQRSMRGAARDTLVRRGTARAIVRGEARATTRAVLIEAEIPAEGTTRLLVNRQPTRRRAELAETLTVTVFAPEDLELVQGGPSARRDYLDDVLVTRHPRLDALGVEVERTLRQRAALLRQAGGRLDAAVTATLEVWDARLAESGSALVAEREALATALAPRVSAAYARLSGNDDPVGLSYRRSWDGDLHDALVAARPDDVRRQHTTVGPHRDDVELTIGPHPARTHASQGEQRSLALALRLATHDLRRAEQADAPVLLLDDVFSELDARRAAALVALLPPGQVLLTTAVDLPPLVHAGLVIDVVGGGAPLVAGAS